MGTPFLYKFNNIGAETNEMIRRYKRLTPLEKGVLECIAFGSKDVALEISGGHQRTGGTIRRILAKMIPEYCVDVQDPDYRKMMLVAIYWRYIADWLANEEGIEYSPEREPVIEDVDPIIDDVSASDMSLAGDAFTCMSSE